MQFSAAELKAANVNPATGLATDYLNHFNEVVMLIEMVESMPECAEDIAEWQPYDYRAHFEITNYVGKEVAIASYDGADPALRAEFDTIIKALSDAVDGLRSAILEASQDENRGFPEVLPILDRDIRPLISMAGAMINGHIPVGVEDDNDAFDTQNAIDSLFD